MGCLMKTANGARPNITDAAREMARYCQSSFLSRTHWEGTRYVMRSLNDMRTLRIVSGKGRDLDIEVYRDSDYARIKDDT